MTRAMQVRYWRLAFLVLDFVVLSALRVFVFSRSPLIHSPHHDAGTAMGRGGRQERSCCHRLARPTYR